MDPNTLLEQLRDAHAPETIGWWPIAIGWWLLAIIVVVSVFLLGRAIYRHRQKTAWKRQALKAYQTIKKDYIGSPSSQNLTNIIVLLRRCVASTTEDRNNLSLTGQAWEDYLGKPAQCLNESDISALSQGHYQLEAPLLDSAALNRIEKWIKGQAV